MITSSSTANSGCAADLAYGVNATWGAFRAA